MAGAGQTTNVFTGDPANYSHDFQNQINNYTGKANEQYNQYNADRSAAGNYENAYNEAFNNRQTYGDYMNQAEDKYGVESAKNTYQDSLRAVAATNQAMSALPSTTNANSNVVLNQAQRNAALSNQMNKYQNTLASWQQQNAVDQSALNLALQQAAQLAAGNYQSQQDALSAQMNQYQNAYNIANQTYQNALQQENLLRDVYAKMYADEQAHMQNEYQYWYGNLQDKWKQQEIAAQRYAADSAMRVQQYLRRIAEEQEANKTPTFADYLQSNAAYEGDWAEGVDKDQYLNNMLYRWTYGDAKEKQQIMSGSNYQDYMKRIRGGR